MKLSAFVIALIMLCTSHVALAREGLALRITVIETSGEETHTFATGVLMKLTESVNFQQPGHYEFGIQSREMQPGQVNLVFTLKDLSEGSAIYGGGGAITINVGENADLALKNLETSKSSYRMLVESSYAELPQ